MTQSLIDQMADTVKGWGPFELEYRNSQWCVVTRVEHRDIVIPIQEIMDIAFVENVSAETILHELMATATLKDNI